MAEGDLLRLPAESALYREFVVKLLDGLFLIVKGARQPFDRLALLPGVASLGRTGQGLIDGGLTRVGAGAQLGGGSRSAMVLLMASLTR